MDDENKRFKEMVEYLKTKKYIRNQQDFTERVDSNKTTVSQIINNKISIPDIMFGKISAAFPFISIEWLKKGIGDMLMPSINQVGKNSTQIAGNANQVNSSSTLDKALDEISEMRKLLAEAIKNNKEQADKFFSIIEKMQQ